MKYIFIPLLRLFLVLVTFVFIVPVIFLYEVALLSTWNLELKNNWKKFRANFSKEYFWIEDSEYLSHTINKKYKVYPTVKDFVLNRWVIRKIN